MNKYLGDYNIAKSSSNNMGNILWTKKNPEKLKNKKHHSDKKSSPTNIIYGDYKQKSHLKKVFIINQEELPEKLKNKNIPSDKKFQKSSADNCNIKQGFKRPGR